MTTPKVAKVVFLMAVSLTGLFVYKTMVGAHYDEDLYGPDARSVEVWVRGPLDPQSCPVLIRDEGYSDAWTCRALSRRQADDYCRAISNGQTEDFEECLRERREVRHASGVRRSWKGRDFLRAAHAFLIRDERPQSVHLRKELHHYIITMMTGDRFP